MGAACAPCGSLRFDNKEAAKGKPAGPSRNVIKVMSAYQDDNEELRRQLDELRIRNQGSKVTREKTARQNAEASKQLAAIKDMLEEKDRALVKSRLETALRSWANGTNGFGSRTRLCMEGELKHDQRSAGLLNSKWVEIYLYEGEVQPDDFKPGNVMLVYSDSKESWSTKWWQVIEVLQDVSKSYELFFGVKVFMKGSKKNLLFKCRTVSQRDEWVNSLTAALEEVQRAFFSMNETFTLNLELTKEKIGIQVEEETIAISRKVTEEFKRFEAGLRKEGRELEIEQKKALNYPQNTVTHLERTNEDEILKEEHRSELPCELKVVKIFDDELMAAGLQTGLKIRKINDTTLTGMVYTKQLELLTTTPKPYTLNFYGPKYLTKIDASQHPILKDLISNEENSVKKSFYELIKGTPFEHELRSSNNQSASITALLANQRRLTALLQIVSVN